MFYKDWEKIYKKIILDFNFKTEEDKNASYILNDIIKKRNKNYDIKNLKKIIKNKEVIIFGAGPSLNIAINNNIDIIKDKIKISADGATSALIEQKIIPDIIVTDLDGKISDQIYANLKGAITIIHSHGDNIDKLNENVSKFKGEIIGTTQIDPALFQYLYNFGGFTDGDRAVLLAVHYQAKNIYLIGFNFKGLIGKYSFTKNKNKKNKIKKLKWCKIILDNIKEKNKLHYLN
jgi:uncharacterized Rossmann fold enzyme